MTGFESKREAATDKLQEPEREALKLALEALESMQNAIYNIEGEHVIGLSYAIEQADVTEQAITVIRKALAQPAQEPVCDKDPQGCWNMRCQLGKQCKNLAQPTQEPVTWNKPELETLKHSDNCRYWDENIYCTCGAIESKELQFWKNKVLAQPAQEPVAFDAFLESEDFYELMQTYRHFQVDAAKPFEAVKDALRAAYNIKENT